MVHAAERVAADRVVPERVATQRAAPERTVTEPVATEPVATERAATALGGAARVPEQVRLEESLPVRELEGRIVAVARWRDVGLRALAFYLADMHARGVHQLLGFAGAAQFAEVRLEMSRRSALELIACGRALENLPRIDAAFRDGRLRWARVRLLVRVARPIVEEAWLIAALSMPWNQFQRAVAMGKRGRKPQMDALGWPSVKVAVTRCRSCRASRGLNVHHVRRRSEGGAIKAEYQMTLCGRCRALVHEGLLMIEGATAEEAVFVDRDGRPLSRPSIH